MKEFPLSTSKERLVSVSFCAIMVIVFGVLLYALRNNTMLFVLVALGTVPLTVMMIFSVISLFKSTCFVDKEKMIVEIKGFPSYTRDISQAVLLQTISQKNGRSMTRALIFSDAEDNIIAAVPTLYTFKQGLQAEPMAKEMAAYLGIEFQANVPAWEYDKEAYKQHLKDEAEQDKKDRKERIERRRQKLLKKYKDK